MNPVAWVDLLSFLILVATTVTGGIIRWYLPPGSGHAGHGQGPKLLLGMNRHGWGDIHFMCSTTFLVLMVIHLYQHRVWLNAVLSSPRHGGMSHSETPQGDIHVHRS